MVSVSDRPAEASLSASRRLFLFHRRYLSPTDHRAEGASPSALQRLRPGVLLTEDASAPSLAPTVVPGILPSSMLHDDEVVILLVKPSLWFAFFNALRPVLIIFLIGYLGYKWPVISDLFGRPRNVLLITLVVASGRIVWDLLVWVSHLYVLTNQRIMTIHGVINVHIFQAPLRKIQRTTLYRPIVQRMLGLGTIGYATAATTDFDTLWLMIPRPLETHQKVVNAVNKMQ